MGDNIKVAVRVRPLLPKEKRNGLSILWNVKDKTITSHDSSTSDNYVFDSVYDHIGTTQELYRELCSPIIRNAAEGFHGTIFAYGQSGSGKTYTISGSEAQAGVMELGVDELFDIINKSTNKEFLLRISYMEIYTEKIYDLFDDVEKTLKIQEDADHQISVVGLREEIVNSKEQVMTCLTHGETKRKFAETKANDRSSRSHVILRIIIESRLKGDVDAVMVSHLNFVDLAGSEKAAENSGERFKEGCAINRSLLTLSQVISKLSEGESSYIGYRDSKLTRILQNALGGNSNTLIVCTIAPTSMEESHSTLRFASRAKKIKNKPRLNEVLSESALLKKYADEIKKLQKVVDKLGTQEIQLEKEDLQKKLQEKEELQRQQDELINKLRQMICVSGTDVDTRETKAKKLRRETWCGKKLMRTSSAFYDFKLPSSESLILPDSKLPMRGKTLTSRHFSIPTLMEEEPSFLQHFPDMSTGDDSIFLSLENTSKKSFITDSRSGRRSEDPTQKKEIEDLKKENEELHKVNTQLGNQVLELESRNEKLETSLLTVNVKLDQVKTDLAMQSLELDKATTLARHDISLRDLQEFHRLEKDELEEQIETLRKTKDDLEGQAIPADVQYVKQVELELASNYDKMIQLSKSNKDMQKEIDRLKQELSLSRGEVEHKLRVNDDYIGMLEKQVNQSQEKIKHYERLSVGSVPVGKQCDATHKVAEGPGKDKDDLASKTVSSSVDQDESLEKLDNQLTEELKKQLSDHRQEQEAVLVENEELKKRLSDHGQEQEVVLAQNEELKKQLSDHRQEQEAVLVQNEELKKQLSDHRQEHEAVLVENEELKKRLSDHGQEQEAVLVENEELKKQLSDHRQEQEAVLVQNEELKKQLSDHRQEQEVVLVQNEELKKQLSDHRQEQEVVLVQNEELKKQLSDHRQEQEVVLVQNEELKKQLSNHRQEHEAVLVENEELKKRLSDHGQEQEAVLVENEELKKQLSDHRQEQEAVLVQNEELKKQLSDHGQEQEAVLVQNEELKKQLSDHGQEQEAVLVQNEELKKQLDEAKLELEAMLAEKITAGDMHKDMEKILKEKIALEEELHRKTEQINMLPDNKFCDVSKKGSNFERRAMSMSDVIIHSFDADFTVSNTDISVKMSGGPMSIADELSLVSQSNAQPLSLADELTFASRQQIQPMSLANELSAVHDPGETGHSVCVKNVTAVSMKDEELQTSFDVVDKVQCETGIEEQLNVMTEEVKNIKQDKLDMAKNLQGKESEISNLIQTVHKLEQNLEEKQEELETFSDELLRRQDLISEAQEKIISLEQELREQKEVLEDQQVQTKQLQQNLEKAENGLTQANHTDEGIAEQKANPHISGDVDDEEEEVTFSIKNSKNEDLKREKLEPEQKLKDLQEDFLKREQELEAKIQAKQEELEKARQDLQMVQEEMKTVRNSLEAANAFLEAKEKEVLKLGEEKNSHLEKIVKLQRETQEEKEKNKENVDLKEREISDLKVVLKNLKSYVEEKEFQTDEKDVAIEELQARLSAAVAMEEEVKELTLKLDQTEMNVETKTKQIDELTKMIAEGTTELEAYETEVETLKQRVVEVEEQMAKNEAEFNDIKEAGIEKIDSLTDESSELQYKLANFERCLQEKDHEIQDIHEQIDKMIQDKLQQSQTEILAKQQEIKLLLDNVSSLKEVIKDKDHEIESVLSEKMKLQEGGEEMLKMVHEKHDVDEKLREKTVQLEIELNHKTAELQVMVEYKSKQDAELEDKITEIESLSNEILKLEDAVVEKNQELGILQEEKMSTDAILQDKTALLDDLGKKMNEFENLYQEKSDEVNQCREYIETLEGSIHSLKEELLTAANRKSELELGLESNDLKAKHQAKVEEVSRLKAEIEKLKNCQTEISTEDGQVEKSDVSRKALLNQLFAKLIKSGQSDLTGMIETLEKGGHDDLAIQLRELDVKLAIERVDAIQKQKQSERELMRKEQENKQIYKAIEDYEKANDKYSEKIDSLEEKLETAEANAATERSAKVKMNLEVHWLRDKAREDKERKDALEEEVEYQQGIVRKLREELRKLQECYDSSIAVKGAASPEKQEVSSRSGIIDLYKVVILEGEKKQLQLRAKEDRRQIARCFMQIKSLEEENAVLKKNVIGTPKKVKQDNEDKAESPGLNWSLSELFKRRRSLSYSEVKEKAEAIRRKNSETPLKNSSKENEMSSTPSPGPFSIGELRRRKSLAKTDQDQECKVQ